MTTAQPTEEAFPTPRYRLLLRVSAFANALAWIMLVLACIETVATILNQANTYEIQTFVTFGSFWQKFTEEPVFAFDYLSAWLANCFQGVVYFTVLKGISLGLKMIVETDMNRSNALQEAENE